MVKTWANTYIYIYVAKIYSRPKWLSACNQSSWQWWFKLHDWHFLLIALNYRSQILTREKDKIKMYPIRKSLSYFCLKTTELYIGSQKIKFDPRWKWKRTLFLKNFLFNLFIPFLPQSPSFPKIQNPNRINCQQFSSHCPLMATTTEIAHAMVTYGV